MGPYVTLLLNDTCQNPRIWLNFTTYGGLRLPGGRGQLMFGGLRTTTDRPRYLRCVERPGIVGVTGNLSGVPAGRSGTRNGRGGGFVVCRALISREWYRMGGNRP